MGWFAVFRSRRMAVLFLLGFSSGLPLLLTGQTLQAWRTAEHVSRSQIAAMSSVRDARGHRRRGRRFERRPARCKLGSVRSCSTRIISILFDRPMRK